MSLIIFLGEERKKLFDIGYEVFLDIPEVKILNSRILHFVESEKIDAELMRGIFAHERYGGMPKIGESQILSTRG